MREFRTFYCSFFWHLLMQGMPNNGAQAQWVFLPSLGYQEEVQQTYQHREFTGAVQWMFRQGAWWLGAGLHGEYLGFSQASPQSQSEGVHYALGGSLRAGWTPRPLNRRPKLIGFGQFEWAFGRSEESHWWMGDLTHRRSGRTERVQLRMDVELWFPLGGSHWVYAGVAGINWRYQMEPNAMDQKQTVSHRLEWHGLPHQWRVGLVLCLSRCRPIRLESQLPEQQGSVLPPTQPYNRFRQQ